MQYFKHTSLKSINFINSVVSLFLFYGFNKYSGFNFAYFIVSKKFQSTVKKKLSVKLNAVVGKLLLKSNCVTLLPLLLKETNNF
jgi:hypothetical protein